MTPLPHIQRLLAVAALAVVATASLRTSANAAPAPPAVPADIAVPDGNKLFLVGHATGVQIYSCTSTSTGFAWQLVAPKATLYDDHGKVIATHFGGPTWQATDGSSVVGKRDRQVTVDPSAIAWLRLSASSVSAGADGARLAGTTWIQRIDTTGGLAPATGCDALSAGSVREVQYTADYTFWKATATA
jgi:hypothetical protein